MALERFADAVESCDRALAAKPDYADAHNRGNALREALAASKMPCASYAAALERDLGRVDALNNLGLALVGLQRHAQALERFDAALVLDPEHIGALHNRANALAGSLARSMKSAGAMRSGVGPPARARRYAQYAGRFLLAKLRRYSEALASYDAALAAAPDRLDIEVNRGTVLLDLDRPDEAMAAFDKALAHDPANASSP